jgi:hypothetical protein
MNSIFATTALKRISRSDFFIYEELRVIRMKFEISGGIALKQGMISLPDTSGTNIDVQIFDTAKINWANSSFPKPNLAIQNRY